MRKKLFVILLSVCVISAFSFAGAGAIFAGNGSSEVTVDGFTYSISSTGSTAVLEKIDVAKSGAVTIPSTFVSNGKTYSVTSMDVLSWRNKCTKITSLTIPDSITDMNSTSFRYFSGLSEIYIPGSVKKFTGSFQYNSSLTKITFGEGMEEIASNSMLTGCSKVTDIVLPSTLKKLSKPATFANAAALKNINLPDGLTISEGGTFSGCTSLASVTIPASLSVIPYNTFKNCTALSSVTAKGKITEIGSSAFEGCSKLPSMSFASDATKLGASAFAGCVLFKSADLTNVETIGFGAFENDNLQSVKFGSKLTSIDGWAFLNNSNLTDIGKLPDSLTSIGNYSFYNCPLSEKITIPDSVTSIGDGAFYTYNKGVSKVKEVVIGNGVTKIPTTAFKNNDKLETVTIGSGITEIASDAFVGCDSLKKVTIDSSSDDVSIPDGTFAKSVEVIFKVASIDARDDKISDAADALTLQEAINKAAKDGQPVTIEKNIKLTKSLNVPAGKEVVLKSTGNYSIIGAGKKDGGPVSGLMTINSGATLTLNGKITLNGRNFSNKSSLITDKGTFNLKEGTVKSAVLTTSLAGAVNVDSGKMTISGGSITGNKVEDSTTASAEYSGIVRVCNGGSLEMTGGQISSNKCSGENSFVSSSGVLVYGGGSFTMNGGKISNNSGYRGSAVMLYGNDKKSRSSFTMNNGEISGNTSSKYTSTLEASGAVHVEDYADFTMNGGTITGNTAGGDKSVGGGVCVIDSGAADNISKKTASECGTGFTMDGGTISSNSAQYAGGGIYTFSNNTTLNAGKISGNKSFMGGGVYSEGNRNGYSDLKMTSVLITGNDASKLGGGMWYCNTGKTTIAEGTAAIYGNSAKEAGDDFVSTEKINKKVVTLADRMPGGGAERWTDDGGVIGGNNSPFGTADKTARYDSTKAADILTGLSGTKSYALKSLATDGARSAAAASANLVIRDNTASYGGGVGANGGVDVGKETRTWKLNVSKEWSGNGTRPESVTIDLMSNGKVLDKLVLTEKNSWKGSFDKLPMDLAGKLTVSEEPVSGWTATVGKVSDVNDSYEASVTVTNNVTTVPPTVVPDNPSGGTTVTPPANNSGTATKNTTHSGSASGHPVNSKTVKPSSPKTGDANMIYLYGMLAVACAALAAVLTALRRTKMR